MKKLYFLLLLFTGMMNAQIINFPDTNFKAALLAATPTNYMAKDLGGSFIKIDANSDGEIQNSEAVQVSYVFLSQRGISDMIGIENFTNLTTLICEMNSISSLNVSALVNLNILRCSQNNLSSLDVSSLVNLVQLNCGYNHISTLDLSNLNNMSILGCEYNNLTSLNVGNMSGLSQLMFDNNQISSLDLSANNALTVLHCTNNQLPSLDFSNLSNITDVTCTGNPISSLNFQNLTHLINLYAGSDSLSQISLVNLPVMNILGVGGGTGLTSLDLSAVTTTTQLFVSGYGLTTLNLNPLTNLTLLHIMQTSATSFDFSSLTNLATIDISENPNLLAVDLSSNINLYSTKVHQNDALTYINIKNGKLQDIPNMIYDSSLPNLRFVCTDESEIASVQSRLNLVYQPLVIPVSSYCSFTPGGNYNTIRGTVTFDANHNGCDALDDKQPNVRINITNGTNTGAGFTSSLGDYTFFTQTGSNVITPAVENPAWFTFSPASATIPFANNNNNIVTQNFCIMSNGVHPDVEVIVAPVTPARPGFDAVYKLVYKNKGNQTLSGNVTFGYDDNVLELVSSTVAPNSQSTGSLSYDYTNLLPFENRSFYITLHVNAPTDTPAVNIGDQLNFTATANPMATDEIPSDNTFQFNQTVVGSFDPNDITCIEGNVVPPAEIGNYLHYIINFENTGTADAENIVVRDAIDTAQFDVSSLQVLNSSAQVTAKLTGNVAEFIFQNINLHSGGHGNILIKVRSKNTLVQGNTVSKRANIYFDYNAPIDTNLENTTFQALSNPDFEADASISVYPNPAKENVNISCNNNISSVQLYDVQGRLLQTSLVNDNQTTLDISSQSNGVYFVKVLSDKGILVHKLIKE